MGFWDGLQAGIDHLKTSTKIAGGDPASVDDMTPTEVFKRLPIAWAENGNLFARYSDETVVDLGPITGPPPKSHLVSLMRNLTPEDRQEVMGHFCSECGDEQPDGRRCQCWNDE